MTVRLIEGQVPYKGGTAIEITADKVINLLLRSEDNLLQVNQDNELYCDLQLANGITPSSAFPVGVTTGIVNANDGRPQNGLLLHYETTSGAYAQWLYAQDGYFYLDGGTGVFKKVYYAQDVDDAIQALADSLATVAFTGDYNDLINKPTIGNAVLTIQKNGTTIDTFTANATVDKTINVTVPTKLTDLQNDLVNDGKLTIKENNVIKAEFTANDATNVFVNLPGVINNTTTPDSANSLSAAMGKELQDQINNLNSIGRFLSLWNCTTGLPQTNPTTSPYMYHTGDYFVVGDVNSTINYKPDGSSYTIGVASTTVETGTVSVGDMYFYDGTDWILKRVAGQTLPIDSALSTTSINAVENRVVTNALLNKADKTEINTKTFYLSNILDLTTAQAVYDWYLAGKNPIMVDQGVIFTSPSVVGGNCFMHSCVFEDHTSNSYSSLYQRLLILALDGSGNVTGITQSRIDLGSYISVGTNYSTPYTPQYDGSPATKKYVDDKKNSISVTLLAANWSNNSITVTATGVTSSNTVIISPDPSSIIDYADSSVYCSAQGTDSLTFNCDTEPTNDLTVNVVILN